MAESYGVIWALVKLIGKDEDCMTGVWSAFRSRLFRPCSIQPSNKKFNMLKGYGYQDQEVLRVCTNIHSSESM